jgi:hypothetical protein
MATGGTVYVATRVASHFLGRNGDKHRGNGNGKGKELPCQNHEARLKAVEGSLGRVEGSISGLYTKLDGYQRAHEEQRASLEGRLGELTGEIRARMPERLR